MMPELTSDQIVERIKDATGIDENNYTSNSVKDMNDKVWDFIIQIKGIFPLLEQFKTYIKMMDD